MHRWYKVAFVITAVLFFQNQVFAQKVRTRESDDADFAYMQRLVKNPNFKHCVSRGWSAERLLPKCEQLMNAIVELESKADNCFRTDRWDCVVSSITNLYSLAPGSSKTFYQRGISYLELGKTQEGIRDLKKVLEHYPDNAEVQEALAKAERKEQSIRPLKTDIKGFRPGMTIEEVKQQIQSLTTRQCPKDIGVLLVRGTGQAALPCYDVDDGLVYLNASESISFVFTNNLAVSKLTKVRYSIASPKPYDQMLAAVIEQFKVAPELNRNKNHKDGIWDTWDLPESCVLTFSGGGTYPYTVAIESQMLIRLDKNEAQNAVKNIPAPKF